MLCLVLSALRICGRPECAQERASYEHQPCHMIRAPCEGAQFSDADHVIAHQLVGTIAKVVSEAFFNCDVCAARSVLDGVSDPVRLWPQPGFMNKPSNTP